jgi:NitT/TauT family transport system substrate-binding protein
MAARRRGRGARAAATLAALVLPAALVAGCSDDGGGDGASSAGSSTPTRAADASPRVPEEIDPGCGAQAVTDPADLDAGRVLARCEAGYPEPDPLAAPRTVRVAVPEVVTEELAPLLVARDQGEFEAEGLTVELVQMDDREALDALDAGEVDLVAGAVDGPFLDALDQGSGARLVLGGVVASNPNDTTRGQTGLWVRDNALGEDGLSDLELQPVGVPDGMRSSATYPIGLVLGQTDVTLNEVALADVGGDDAAGQLLDGTLAAAWLDGGTWHRIAGQPGYHLAATLPATESIDGTIASERLVGPDRAVGVAYTRAIIRTINTHLTGDYRKDAEVMGVLAESTGMDAGTLGELPPLLFDWEVREGTVDRIQDALVRLGGVTYDERFVAERYVDRSLAADAVGAGA